MGDKTIRKIIYFDRETIRNILQEQHHGDFSRKSETNSTIQNDGKVEAEVSTDVKLNVPFIARLGFLFHGKLAASYIVKKDSSTTITSTELSEFEQLKTKLIELDDVQIHDIENSSTSFRVAGGYLRFAKSGIEDVDIKEFKTVMESYEGYDTYSVNNENKYVRFNNSAFLSNYRRNDLLATTMTLYCIPVGKFSRERFDFVKEISKMQHLFSKTHRGETLADIYPPKSNPTYKKDKENTTKTQDQKEDNDNVVLYDVVYACIVAEVANE